MIQEGTLPEKSWDTEDVDGHVHGMRMVGTIECDLKEPDGIIKRSNHEVPDVTHLFSNVEQGGHDGEKGRMSSSLIVQVAAWQA